MCMSHEDFLEVLKAEHGANNPGAQSNLIAHKSGLLQGGLECLCTPHGFLNPHDCQLHSSVQSSVVADSSADEGGYAEVSPAAV